MNQYVVGAEPHPDEVDPGCPNRPGQGADTATFGRSHGIDGVALTRDCAHLGHDPHTLVDGEEIDLTPDRIDRVDLDVGGYDMESV